MRTARYFGGAHGCFIDLELRLVGPYAGTAGDRALEVVDGTMNFQDMIIIESSLLKLAVHIRRNNEIIQVPGGDPIPKNGEALMGSGVAIEVGAVPVKAPAEMGIGLEVFRVCRLNEAQSQALIPGVGIPEPLITAKVGQPRVNPHASPGRDDQSRGIANGGCRCGQVVGCCHGLTLNEKDSKATETLTVFRIASKASSL